MSAQQPSSGQRARSVRLIFTYEGDDIRLESGQPVEMAAPPSDPVEGWQDETGSGPRCATRVARSCTGGSCTTRCDATRRSSRPIRTVDRARADRAAQGAAKFCGDGKAGRLLTVDEGTAMTVACAQVPNWNMVMVIVNSMTYEGVWISRARPDGGSWRRISRSAPSATTTGGGSIAAPACSPTAPMTGAPTSSASATTAS